jgi:hypothetical protein
MKMNNLLRTISHNWPIKVFSLLLAVALYLVIHFTTMATVTLFIPLRVIEPVGFSATSTVDDSVELSIYGDKKYIYLINPSAIEATADFSTVSKSGVATRDVMLSYDDTLFDIELNFTTDPESVKIFYQDNDNLEEGNE